MRITCDDIDLLFVLLKGNASVNFAVFGMKMCNDIDKNFLKFGVDRKITWLHDARRASIEIKFKLVNWEGNLLGTVA